MTVRDLVERDLCAYMLARGFQRVEGHWVREYLKFRHRRLVQWLIPIFAQAPSIPEAQVRAVAKLAGEIDMRLPRK